MSFKYFYSLSSFSIFGIGLQIDVCLFSLDVSEIASFKLAFRFEIIKTTFKYRQTEDNKTET